MDNSNKILIYGCGNPSRQDDALGILFCQEIENWARKENIDFIDTDSTYQFNIEDASNICGYTGVLFVDAANNLDNHFTFEKIKGTNKVEFSMHYITPSFIIYLTKKLFNENPMAYQILLQGYEWKLDKEMTVLAKKNLEIGLNHIKNLLLMRKLEEPISNFIKQLDCCEKSVIDDQMRKPF